MGGYSSVYTKLMVRAEWPCLSSAAQLGTGRATFVLFCVSGLRNNERTTNREVNKVTTPNWQLYIP